MVPKFKEFTMQKKRYKELEYKAERVMKGCSHMVEGL